MKIHEYQARDLLSSYALPVPPAEVITDAGQAADADAKAADNDNKEEVEAAAAQ